MSPLLEIRIMQVEYSLGPMLLFVDFPETWNYLIKKHTSAFGQDRFLKLGKPEI